MKAFEVSDTNFVARFEISTKSWSRKKKEKKIKVPARNRTQDLLRPRPTL